MKYRIFFRTCKVLIEDSIHNLLYLIFVSESDNVSYTYKSVPNALRDNFSILNCYATIKLDLSLIIVSSSYFIHTHEKQKKSFLLTIFYDSLATLILPISLFIIYSHQHWDRFFQTPKEMETFSNKKLSPMWIKVSRPTKTREICPIHTRRYIYS